MPLLPARARPDPLTTSSGYNKGGEDDVFIHAVVREALRRSFDPALFLHHRLPPAAVPPLVAVDCVAPYMAGVVCTAAEAAAACRVLHLPLRHYDADLGRKTYDSPLATADADLNEETTSSIPGRAGLRQRRRGAALRALAPLCTNAEGAHECVIAIPTMAPAEDDADRAAEGHAMAAFATMPALTQLSLPPEVLTACAQHLRSLPAGLRCLTLVPPGNGASPMSSGRLAAEALATGFPALSRLDVRRCPMMDAVLQGLFAAVGPQLACIAAPATMGVAPLEALLAAGVNLERIVLQGTAGAPSTRPLARHATAATFAPLAGMAHLRSVAAPARIADAVAAACPGTVEELLLDDASRQAPAPLDLALLASRCPALTSLAVVASNSFKEMLQDDADGLAPEDMPPPAGTALLQALPLLASTLVTLRLTVSNCPSDALEPLRALRMAGRLEALHLDVGTAGLDLSPIGDLRSLRRLFLDMSSAPGAVFRHKGQTWNPDVLARLYRLEHLSCPDSAVGADALNALAPHQCLRELFCLRVGEAGGEPTTTAALAGLRSLRTLRTVANPQHEIPHGVAHHVEQGCYVPRPVGVDPLEDWAPGIHQRGVVLLRTNERLV